MKHNEWSNNHQMVGWREWLALPQLGIDTIKAKVDTGARTSALHAYYVDPFMRARVQWVRFGIHPVQDNTDVIIECEAPVKDQRMVTDSGGHMEQRFVIETEFQLGKQQWNAEMTLTSRDNMKFRMLLGRRALEDRFIVNPAGSYLQGKKPYRR